MRFSTPKNFFAVEQFAGQTWRDRVATAVSECNGGKHVLFGNAADAGTDWDVLVTPYGLGFAPTRHGKKALEFLSTWTANETQFRDVLLNALTKGSDWRYFVSQEDPVGKVAREVCFLDTLGIVQFGKRVVCAVFAHADRGLLVECLKRLEGQLPDQDIVVFVDPGHRTFENLRRLLTEYRVDTGRSFSIVEGTAPRGFQNEAGGKGGVYDAAWSACVHALGADIVVSVEDDVHVSPDFIEVAVKNVLRNPYMPFSGAPAGFDTNGPDNDHQVEWDRVSAFSETQYKTKFFDEFHACEGFTSEFGVAFSRQFYFDVIKRALGLTADGMDFSLNAYMRHASLRQLKPVLPRAQNVGRFNGTHDSSLVLDLRGVVSDISTPNIGLDFTVEAP